MAREGYTAPFRVGISIGRHPRLGKGEIRSSQLSNTSVRTVSRFPSTLTTVHIL